MNRGNVPITVCYLQTASTLKVAMQCKYGLYVSIHLFITRKLQVKTLKLNPPPPLCIIVSRTHRHSPSIFENVDSCCSYICTLLLLLHAKFIICMPRLPSIFSKTLEGRTDGMSGFLIPCMHNVPYMYQHSCKMWGEYNLQHVDPCFCIHVYLP